MGRLNLTDLIRENLLEGVIPFLGFHGGVLKVYTPVYFRVFLLSLPIHPCPIYFSMHRASCSQTRADSPTGAWARTKDSEERPLQKHLYRWVAWQLADYQGMTVSEIPWAVSFFAAFLGS